MLPAPKSFKAPNPATMRTALAGYRALRVRLSGKPYNPYVFWIAGGTEQCESMNCRARTWQRDIVICYFSNTPIFPYSISPILSFQS